MEFESAAVNTAFGHQDMGVKKFELKVIHKRLKFLLKKPLCMYFSYKRFLVRKLKKLDFTLLDLETSLINLDKYIEEYDLNPEVTF